MLQRPNLCTKCSSVLTDIECVRRATSIVGFNFQVPLRTLYDSAEIASCRMCSIFLYIALRSLDDPAIIDSPVADFLDAHATAFAVLTLRAHLQPEGQRKSAYDIHELDFHGTIVGTEIHGDLTDDCTESACMKFKVYVSPGGREASYISSRECDQDMGSTAAYSKIRSWMASCDAHHSSCPRPVPKPLPTRLLDLSDPAALRIRETRGECGQYAALSYCWGGGQTFVTSISSLDDALERIPMSSLPLTFQDAVAVTRSIGLAYLWVDALCIIQDSIEDRDTEVAAMAQIYQNASVVIMAASASGSDKGLLAPTTSPRSLETESTGWQLDLPIAFPDGGTSVIHLEYDRRENHTSLEPLDSRAWAYQEYMLCRRALIYGTSTLSWRCGQGIQTWNSWLRAHLWLAAQFLLPEHGKRDPCKETWMGLVTLYARRHLTFPEDKLPAISALASEVRRLSIENGGEPGKYLAGMWEHDLLHQMLWLTILDESRDVRRAAYCAPSWSWASVDCPISFSDLRIGRTEDSGMELQMIHCTVTPRSDLLPLGQVTGGVLRVEGYLISGTEVPKPETWIYGRSQPRRNNPVATLYLDCYRNDEAAVSKAQSCVWLRVQEKYGLALEHVEAAIYRRVGCVVSINNWSGLSMERRVVDLI